MHNLSVMSKMKKGTSRRGRQMSRAVKPFGAKSDEHLATKKLEEDSKKQMEAHMNEVRKDKGLSPKYFDDDPQLAKKTPDDDVRTLEDEGDAELVDGTQLILGLRLYERVDGLPVGRAVDGEEICKTHRRIRREREEHRDFNGQKVRVGDVKKRQDKDGAKRTVHHRKAGGVLMSAMVRVMPHEGLVMLNLPKAQLALAMDATVAAVERETGCEVISAVVHRMSGTDCHIHIQYTQIQALLESTSMLGRRMKPWRELASRLARESLAADGVDNPGPVTVRRRKDQLIAEEAIPPKPVAEVEYRKIPGKRDLKNNRILGYSFLQKMNMVRAAEAGGEPELAAEVTMRNDWRERFAPIAKLDDATQEAKYLDLWLERVWRKNLTGQLPEATKAKLIEGGVQAARNYVVLGTSIPDDEHIRRRVKELAVEAKELSEKKAEIDDVAAGVLLGLDGMDGERADMAKTLEKSASRIADLEISEKAGKKLREAVKILVELVKKSPSAMMVLRKIKPLWAVLGKIAILVGMDLDGPQQQK